MRWRACAWFVKLYHYMVCDILHHVVDMHKLHTNTLTYTRTCMPTHAVHTKNRHTHMHGYRIRNLVVCLFTPFNCWRMDKFSIKQIIALMALFVLFKITGHHEGSLRGWLDSGTISL